MCVSGGKKCSFFGHFGVLCFLETPALRFAFLPYYRRNTEVSEDLVTTNNETDYFTIVGFLLKKHIKNLFFGYLNINSLRNKREFLEPLIRNHFDIFLVSETKLDSSFSGSKFTIPAYRLFRKDRNQYGGGLIFYVNQDIPCKTINTFNFPNSLEVLPLEINLRNRGYCTFLAAINLRHLMMNIFWINYTVL